MASAVASIAQSSAYERRLALAHETDERQEQAIGSVLESGFFLDWNAILSDVSDDAPDSIERAISDQLHDDRFTRTVAALGINGKLIATHAQLRSEQEAGLRDATPLIVFTEAPAIATPEQAIAYWQKILGLTDEQVETLLRALPAMKAQARNIAERIQKAIIERIAAMWRERQQQLVLAKSLGAPLNEGDTLAAFVKRSREIMPDYSRSLLETEYRTRLAQQYAEDRQELITQRSDAFPFLQFMGVKDARQTWWICLPMSKAGPGGSGYIAATDDPIWIAWTPPNHYQCRSLVSAISYREAQRMGILAKDGRTKIAVTGNNPSRPFGDPPKFATEPGGTKIRAVEPAEGFGG